MTAKRFTIDSDGKYFDRVNKRYVTLDNLFDELNTLHEENDALKQELKTKAIVNKQYEELQRVKKENKQLKSTMKEVAELLEEEVDLFSDKATEHDINDYVELRELDNKDAYYMAVSTKKAIKMLKELEE
jgi:myosin heavy subunit